MDLVNNMGYLYADKYGYEFFKIRNKGKLIRADRFGYFWSNVGECYVLFFQQKLSHHQTSQCYVALNSSPYGDEIVSRCCSSLKKHGYLNIDKTVR